MIQDKWISLENKSQIPKRVNRVKHLEFDLLKEKILNQDEGFIINMIESLYSGDFYILKNAFKKEFMDYLKTETFKYYKNKPSDFYKMLDDYGMVLG